MTHLRCFLLVALSAAVVAVSDVGLAAIDNPIVYSQDQTAASTIHDRDQGYRPTYVICADKQRTADEAKKLVDDLGLSQHLLD